jgi:hypothetical protein
MDDKSGLRVSIHMDPILVIALAAIIAVAIRLMV